MNKAMIALTLMVAAAGSALGSHQTLTYIDLTARLTDLQRLAVLPQPGERCAQWSSYDRASVYDEATGRYVNWDANGDSHGVLREENGEVVLGEMKGPGCIWRIWSAKPKSGHVKIYLDGADQPAVDLPFEDYFSGKQFPFIGGALVHYTASGANNYVPIPYQKSCKITAEDGWGAYYHFTYSTFPEGTKLPTFSRNLSGAESLALSKANLILSSRLGMDPAGRRPGERRVERLVNIEAGKTVSAARLSGPRAITAIEFRPGEMKDPAETLRSVVLRIRWDGEKEPSVWCPLGDFFGSAPGTANYKSLPLGMSRDGFYSFWYMPFGRSAEIELVNEGSQDLQAGISIVHAPLECPISEQGRFHAKWHRDAFLPSEPERRIDWPMLKTEGRGRYCGVALHVFNPKGGWWGEGDEKFFVDGEKFPSTFGTGSEDYFGYAWGNPELFQNAYHNQTVNENGNAGNVLVNRWHITDNVPFDKSFESCIEKYFPNDRPTLYAATVYWYQAPGGRDPYLSVPVSERVGYFSSGGR